MGKYKKELVSKIVEEQKFQKKQSKLKEKYELSDNVVIIEKDNMIKFFVRIIESTIQKMATIILLILAIIGLFTLLYPEIRNVFFEVVNQILQQYFSQI